MHLILGVLEQAYSDAHSGAKTTGEVAEILEDKYHVMELFYEENIDFIAQVLADGVSNAIEALGMGAPPGISLTLGAQQKIDARFREFLAANRLAGILPAGQGSGAAVAGKTSRTKSGYTKGKKARPMFIDTGLYQASFRAWVEE